jgi:hypothetical protein
MCTFKGVAMKLQRLSNAAYRGLNLEQIGRLVRQEACVYTVRDHTEIEQAWIDEGLQFRPEAMLLYAEIATVARAHAVASGWLWHYAQITGDKSPIRAQLLAVQRYGELFATYRGKRLEGARAVVPAFRAHLKDPSASLGTEALKLAKKLAIADKRIVDQTARAVLRSAIRQDNIQLQQQCLRLLKRPMTTSERRMRVRQSLSKMMPNVTAGNGSSPVSVAQEIVKLGLVKGFGPALRRELTQQCFDLQTIKDALQIVGLALRESDLLKLRRLHMKVDSFAYREVEISDELVKMNVQHRGKLTEALLRARNRALMLHDVAWAHEFSRRLGSELQESELRRAIAYHGNHPHPHAWNRRDLGLAQDLLALSIRRSLSDEATAADQEDHTGPRVRLGNRQLQNW